MRETSGGRDEIGKTETSRTIFAPRELEAGDRSRHSDRKTAENRFVAVRLALLIEKHVLGGQSRRHFPIIDGDRFFPSAI